MDNIEKFKQLEQIIIENDQILIFHHTRPDGDCLGSAFGLKELIKLNFPKKHVNVIGNNYNLFNFLKFDFYDFSLIKNFDQYLGIIVDVNNFERIENGILLEKFHFKNLIRFDHHNNFSNLKIQLQIDDPTYSSCCELLMDFVIHLNWKINSKIATFFYLGIYTDTGSFSFPSVNARTFQMLEICLKNNADKNTINNQLKKRSLNDLKILKTILNHFVINGNVIYFYMDLNKQKELNINSPINANFPNALSNIEGYEIWIYFTQEKLNLIRCEFRSSKYNVKQLAEKWNGGGHINASGCIINDVKKIKAVVFDANLIIKNKFNFEKK